MVQPVFPLKEPVRPAAVAGSFYPADRRAGGDDWTSARLRPADARAPRAGAAGWRAEGGDRAARRLCVFEHDGARLRAARTGGGRRAVCVLGFAALVGELHAGRRPIPVAFIRRPRVAPSECQGPDRVERRIREAGLGGSCRQNGAVAVRRRAVHAVYAVHAVRLSDVFVSVSVAVPRSRSAYQQSTSWMRLRSASLPMARQRAS